MLDQLVIILRAAQLYTHNAHNLVQGPTFFEDHEVLGGLYPKYEAAYDSVVERMIGLGQTPDLTEVQVGAVEVMRKLAQSSDPTHCFRVILQVEDMLCRKVEACLASHPYSEGTKQLLGTLADESEARQYQLKQRVK